MVLAIGHTLRAHEALSRLIGIQVPVDIGDCPADADFRAILIKACRDESAYVAVGWGQDWVKDRVESGRADYTASRCQWSAVTCEDPCTCTLLSLRVTSVQVGQRPASYVGAQAP